MFNKSSKSTPRFDPNRDAFFENLSQADSSSYDFERDDEDIELDMDTPINIED